MSTVQEFADKVAQAHDVLGVDIGADEKELKSAYRGLVREHHPDRYPDPEERAFHTERMQEVNVAYEFLNGDAARNAANVRAGHQEEMRAKEAEARANAQAEKMKQRAEKARNPGANFNGGSAGPGHSDAGKSTGTSSGTTGRAGGRGTGNASSYEAYYGAAYRDYGEPEFEKHTFHAAGSGFYTRMNQMDEVTRAAQAWRRSFLGQIAGDQIRGQGFTMRDSSPFGAALGMKLALSMASTVMEDYPELARELIQSSQTREPFKSMRDLAANFPEHFEAVTAQHQNVAVICDLMGIGTELTAAKGAAAAFRL